MKLLLLSTLFLGQLSSLQHDPRSNRVWTVNYEFVTCGDVRITRMDLMRADLPGSPATVMPHQKFTFQWSYQPTGDFTLGEMALAVSKERYAVRIFLETLEGGTEVRKFYFSIFGGASQPIPPLEEEVTEETFFLWMIEHDWTPVSKVSPNDMAFNVEFSKLAWKLDSDMDFELLIRGEGCEE